MPDESIIIVDDTILEGYWSKDSSLYEKIERFKLFLSWRGTERAKVLQMDWESYKAKLTAKEAGDDEKKKLTREMIEHTKSFIGTQQDIREDASISEEENLIQLIKALNELGKVIVVSQKYGTDKLFQSKISIARAYTIEEFNQLVNEKCNGFYEYIAEKFFDDSSA